MDTKHSEAERTKEPPAKKSLGLKSIRAKLALQFGTLLFIALTVSDFVAVNIARETAMEKVQVHLIDKANDAALLIDKGIAKSFSYMEVLAHVLFHDDRLTRQERASFLDEEAERTHYLSIFEYEDTEWPTIVSSVIKIKERGKEHIIKTNKGESTSYNIYENGVKINSDNFIVEFGEIKLENGQIIELPPIKFRKYVNSKRWNVVWDALNQDTPTEEIFQGTIEEYREWKKRNR